MSGRFRRQAMCSMKRVLPQPVGPLSSTGSCLPERRLEHRHLVADRLVVRLIFYEVFLGLGRARRGGFF